MHAIFQTTWKHLPLNNFCYHSLDIWNQCQQAIISKKISTRQKILLVIPINEIDILLREMNEVDELKKNDKTL